MNLIIWVIVIVIHTNIQQVKCVKKTFSFSIDLKNSVVDYVFISTDTDLSILNIDSFKKNAEMYKINWLLPYQNEV